MTHYMDVEGTCRFIEVEYAWKNDRFINRRTHYATFSSRIVMDDMTTGERTTVQGAEGWRINGSSLMVQTRHDINGLRKLLDAIEEEME